MSSFNRSKSNVSKTKVVFNRFAVVSAMCLSLNVFLIAQPSRAQSIFEQRNAASVVTNRKKPQSKPEPTADPKARPKSGVVKNTPRNSGTVIGGVFRKPKVEASVTPRRPSTVGQPPLNQPRNGGNLSNRNPKVPAAAPQNLTIQTGKTGLEVFLNDVLIGKTGTDGNLNFSAANGSYSLTVYQGSNQVLPPTSIKVQPYDTKVFDYKNQILSRLRNSDPTQVKTPSESAANNGGNNVSAVEQPKNTSAPVVSEVDVDAILERFADPRTTESVGTQEWQSIYRTAQSKLVEGVDAVEIKYLMSLSEGYLGLKEGNYMAAINMLESATRQLPSHPLGHYLLGEALQQTGDVNGAIASYQKSVQANSSFALGYHRLGDIYLRLKKSREAATNFQNAIAKGDDTPLIRMKLAQVKIKNKNCSAAIADLEALTETAQADGEVYGLLGDCYVSEKRDSSASQAYTKAFELERNAQIAYKLGVVSVRLKEYEKARKAFAEALETDPEGKVINAKEARNQLEKLDKRLH